MNDIVDFDETMLLTEVSIVESIVCCDMNIQQGIQLNKIIVNIESIRDTIKVHGITDTLVSVIGSGLDSIDCSLSELDADTAILKLDVALESFIDIIRKTIAVIISSIKQFIFEFTHNLGLLVKPMKARYLAMQKYVDKNGVDSVTYNKIADKGVATITITHEAIMADYKTFDKMFAQVLTMLDKDIWKNTKNVYGKFNNEHIDALAARLNYTAAELTPPSIEEALVGIKQSIANTEEFLKVSVAITKQLRKFKINKNFTLKEDELDPVIFLQLCTRTNNIFIKAIFGNLKAYSGLLKNIKKV